MQGGANELNDTRITNNTAQQRGGGIVFANNYNTSSCYLRLSNTTLRGNHALSGGGIFVAVPGNGGINITQLEQAAPASGNTAVYSAGVSIAPLQLAIDTAEFQVPSSAADNGLIPLVVYAGEAFVRVQVDFCDNNTDMEAYLSGAVEKSQADGRGTTEFRALRLLDGTVGRVYCLRVSGWWRAAAWCVSVVAGSNIAGPHVWEAVQLCHSHRVIGGGHIVGTARPSKGA
jgi:hypothetical protein